jgi:nucleoside-diphosphate-sugar epimerase
MHIFLTGNTGRIGTVVQRQLEEAGHTVTGYDITNGHDILNAKAVKEKMAQCDAVAHLAALMGRAPSEDIVTSSIIGTWNILQAAEHHQINRVIYYSSVNAMGLFTGQNKPDYIPFN